MKSESVSKRPERDKSPEKRQYPRSPLFFLEVKGKHYEKVFYGYTADLGPGGLRLSTDNAFNVGDKFPVEFVLPDNKTKIKCMCEVVWGKRRVGSELVSESLGIRFVDMNAEKKKLIDEWVRKDGKKPKKG
jgi:Tfp pilus assembly protein PilZ